MASIKAIAYSIDRDRHKKEAAIRQGENERRFAPKVGSILDDKKCAAGQRK